MDSELQDDPMRHCLTTVDDDHTCMLPTDHDGPHEPTADSDIIVFFIEPDGVGVRMKETGDYE